MIKPNFAEFFSKTRRFLSAAILLACLLSSSVIAQTVPGVLLDPPSGPPSPPQPGQLPDTVSAPAFTIRDKFDYRIVQTFGLRGFIGTAIGATIGQAKGTPDRWGQDVPGYIERYGSGFATNLSRQTFEFLLETPLREDPRYFPSEDRSKKLRALNAIKQVVWTKTDSGGSSFAYARVISAFGASQFCNLWQPPGNDSFGNGMMRMGIMLAADAGYNFLQEFVPFTRPISLRHRH